MKITLDKLTVNFSSTEGEGVLNVTLPASLSGR